MWQALMRAIVLGAIGLVACGCSAPRDEMIRTVRIYDLLQAVPGASIQRPSPDHVIVRTGTILDEEGPVLFMHPPSQVTFAPVQVGAESFLAFAIGIQSEAWTGGGDGVAFTVQVKGADPAQQKVFVLYSRYIDPKHRPEDRRWFRIRIPLRRFAGQPIQLVFSTSGGPQNDVGSDWAMWLEPRILLDGK